MWIENDCYVSPSMFLFQIFMSVLKTQDANCLFWKYLEEESTGHNTSDLLGEAEEETWKISHPLMLWAYHSDPLSLGLQIPKQCISLEKEMAAPSSVLAWRIPGTGGAWWAAVYGVAQSRTRLKRRSSSSSSSSALYESRQSAWKWK